jgi:hypothetical protein
VFLNGQFLAAPVGTVPAHAAFRSPNLKAKFSFQTRWRISNPLEATSERLWPVITLVFVCRSVSSVLCCSGLSVAQAECGGTCGLYDLVL